MRVDFFSSVFLQPKKAANKSVQIIQTEFFLECNIVSFMVCIFFANKSGLPDGIFSSQKVQFGKI
jgi:hypothetical protein